MSNAFGQEVTAKRGPLWLRKGHTQWNQSDLSEWLQSKHFTKDVLSAFQTHGIDGCVLHLLTENDFKEMGIKHIGSRKRLLIALAELTQQKQSSVGNALTDGQGDLKSTSGNSLTTQRSRFDSTDSSEIMGLNLDPELPKVALSFTYVFLVFGITAFTMVLAHERLPDMSKYPPLPDLILDNLPYIPWAFEAAEAVGIILLVIWLIILLAHRHRFILLRRFFCLTGTVFLLRCITMIITSLSVPGRHLHDQCKPHVFNSIEEKIWRAREIWLGFGMTLQGVQTCGDYMFSGHTICLTLLNFFITEYTPRSVYQLHILAWVLNLFGIFFILAAHEHYSIDVFVAFYISSRLFLYYHWLSNNCSLMKRDQKRARVWFPLFSYFESRTNMVVPNDFEIPFTGTVERLIRKFK